MTLIGLPLLSAHAAHHPRALPQLKALAAFIVQSTATTAGALADTLPALVAARSADRVTFALPHARVEIAVNPAIAAARVVAVTLP